MSDAFSFKITKEIGILSTNAKGWSIELNMVAWGDREPKYDIRSWSKDHQKMGKGITLKEEELKKLQDLLNKTTL